MVVSVLQIPLLLGLGALALVLLGLSYGMFSLWWIEREKARRWSK